MEIREKNIGERDIGETVATIRFISATSLVAVRNTVVFQSALTALTALRTLGRRNACFPLLTYLIYVAPG
jgi:hypothetical protein